MFNWKRYAGFSLICASECRLSHSRSLKLLPFCFPFLPRFALAPSPLLSTLLSLQTAKSACILSLATRPPSPSFSPLLGLSFSPVWSLPSPSQTAMCRSPTPPTLGAQLRWFDAALLSCALVRVCTCALIHACVCVLELHRVCLLCEFDTSKGCHELDKSIPSSVLHWQN